MVQLQILNKVLNSGDIQLITNNGLDKTYFPHYEAEFNFIWEHYRQYGIVPDQETFLSNFPDFETFECSEPDSYLVSTLEEEKMYADFAPVVTKAAEIANGNALDAISYIQAKLKALEKRVGFHSVDIVHQSESRFLSYQEKANGNLDDFCITTGFPELDHAVQGWSRSEEFVVLFARTNQGKSWVLTKFMTGAWVQGRNVGFFSPEMSGDKIGYRFDTLVQHFDNTALNWGKKVNNYAEYLEKIKRNPATFNVSEPSDFGGSPTVSKLEAWVTANDIQILAIDGLSYLTDERKSKTDNRQAELTHISEDLFQLSKKLRIPVIGVVQANRDGIKINGGTLELENIRDADGIAYNATKVIAVRQKADAQILELSGKKNRDGANGWKLTYQWLPNTGEFRYIPEEDDGNDDSDRDQKAEELRQKYQTEKLPF